MGLVYMVDYEIHLGIFSKHFNPFAENFLPYSQVYVFASHDDANMRKLHPFILALQ